MVVDVLAYAFVGAPVTARAAPRIQPPTYFVRPPPPLGLLVSEPGLDLIACALEEAALFAAPSPAAVIRPAIFAFIASLIIRLARAFAVFITVVIVRAVRFAVRPAAVSAPGRFAGITAAALPVTLLFAALAPVIRLFITAAPAPVIRLFIAAALAPVIRLVVILPLTAAAPVVIIVVVCHLALLQRLSSFT